ELVEMCLGLAISDPGVRRHQRAGGYRRVDLHEGARGALPQRNGKPIFGLVGRPEKPIGYRLQTDIEQRHELVAAAQEATRLHRPASAEAAAMPAPIRRSPSSIEVNANPGHSASRRDGSNR